jgi:hypothetical protein
MEGFEVISVNDDKCIGHVSGRAGDFLIVEHGTLRKSHNPLPLSFAEIDEAGGRVVTTLAHDIVYDAPDVKNGEFDREAAALYYGLADMPAEEGYGDYDENELKTGTDSDAVEQRAEIRSELASGQGAEDRAGAPAEQAPALLGDRQPRETD